MTGEVSIVSRSAETHELRTRTRANDVTIATRRIRYEETTDDLRKAADQLRGIAVHHVGCVSAVTQYTSHQNSGGGAGRPSIVHCRGNLPSSRTC